MELLEMFPPVSSFELDINGETREIRLRKVSLRDHIFCANLFGLEVTEAISKLGKDIDSISKLIYNQIVHDDRIYFKKQKAKAVSIDENGEEYEVVIGGESFLALMIDSPEIYQKVMEAYQTCLIAGLPLLEEKKNLKKAIAK